MFPPGLEPGTFRVLGERDNHYTTETCFNTLFAFISIQNMLTETSSMLVPKPSRHILLWTVHFGTSGRATFADRPLSPTIVHFRLEPYLQRNNNKNTFFICIILACSKIKVGMQHVN